MPSDLSAERFIEELEALQSDEELTKYQRYFKFAKDNQSKDDFFIGVRMGEVFKLSKVYIDMPLAEIEQLLESPVHEVRVGGVSIMDWRARRKSTPESQRRELFDLYLRRHDRINNWDLVDRAAIRVVGGYLFDYEKPRDVLYTLAHSESTWERRTAIVSTAYFIRESNLDDTFQIAEILLNDTENLVQKATGWMLRTAGGKDEQRLLHFLDQHAAAMPRTMLTSAMEKLDKEQRAHYRGLNE